MSLNVFYIFDVTVYLECLFIHYVSIIFAFGFIFQNRQKIIFRGSRSTIGPQLIVDRMFHRKAVGLFYRQSAELSVGSSAPSSDRTISTDDYSASKGNRTLAVSFTSVVSRAFPFIATRNRIFEPISLYFRPFFVIFPQCFSLSSLITQKFNMGP